MFEAPAEDISQKKPDLEIIEISEVPSHYGAGSHKEITARENGKIVHLIEKRPHIFGYSPSEQADAYIDKWQKLRAAGLPVLDTARKASETTVYLPNLTRDGSRLYGKADKHQLKIGGRSWSQTDEYVQNQVNQNEINKEVASIVELANSKNITLPVDDPLELLIHPDGSWELIILDIDMAQIDDKNAVKKNKNVVQEFNNTISDIKHYLETNPFIKREHS